MHFFEARKILNIIEFYKVLDFLQIENAIKQEMHTRKGIPHIGHKFQVCNSV